LLANPNPRSEDVKKDEGLVYENLWGRRKPSPEGRIEERLSFNGSRGQRDFPEGITYCCLPGDVNLFHQGRQCLSRCYVDHDTFRQAFLLGGKSSSRIAPEGSMPPRISGKDPRGGGGLCHPLGGEFKPRKEKEERKQLRENIGR